MRARIVVNGKEIVTMEMTQYARKQKADIIKAVVGAEGMTKAGKNDTVSIEYDYGDGYFMITGRRSNLKK